MSLVSAFYDGPTGRMTMLADRDALAGLYFSNHKHGGPPREPAGESAVFAKTRAQLDRYFAGERFTFDLPLSLRGTQFQRDVWDILLTIPHGETRTYGWIAKKLALPDAARAVGAAVGQNRIGIIVPCHRVIGANGALTGFAGGLENKKFLLQLEGMLLV